MENVQLTKTILSFFFFIEAYTILRIMYTGCTQYIYLGSVSRQFKIKARSTNIQQCDVNVSHNNRTACFSIITHYTINFSFKAYYLVFYLDFLKTQKEFNIIDTDCRNMFTIHRMNIWSNVLKIILEQSIL